MSLRKYRRIINRTHHVSRRHPPTSREERAMQFSSFEALTGFDDDLDETLAETESRFADSPHDPEDGA